VYIVPFAQLKQFVQIFTLWGEGLGPSKLVE